MLTTRPAGPARGSDTPIGDSVDAVGSMGGVDDAGSAKSDEQPAANSSALIPAIRPK